jgi:peptide/nickel transport system permease protein
MILAAAAAPLLTPYGEAEIIRGVVVTRATVVLRLPGGDQVRELSKGGDDLQTTIELRRQYPGAPIFVQETEEIVRQFRAGDARDDKALRQQLAFYDSQYPDAQRVEIKPLALQPPGSRFILGTDELGRDVWTRTLFGARVSLQVGIIATLIACVIGIVLGVCSGYFGGWFDLVVQRIVDALIAFPGLVLALALASIVGSGVWNVTLLLGFLMAPRVVRLARGIVLGARSYLYVDAARAIGASDARIMSRHILPNIWAPVFVFAGVLIGGVILIEASLSFLGVGVPPPTPAWGSMLSGSGRQYFQVAWWLAVFPGAALSLTVVGYNLLGDALRDHLDPRLRRR